MGSSPAAELRRDGATVRVGVEPGAPITSFVSAGADWCADGPWRDYAPSARACVLPTFVAGAAGARFPDGGWLSAEEPTVDVATNADGTVIASWWAPRPYPLGWTRTVSLEAGGALVARYAVTNAQRAPLPFLWGVPISAPWSEVLRLDLPHGARARIAQAFGDGLPAAGSEFAWPSLRDGGHLVDLSRPATLGPRRAVLCFVELPRGRFGLQHGARTLEVRGTPGVVTHARVWVNNDGEHRGAGARRWWRRHAAQREVSTGPAVGAPDLLSDAVGAWGTARWVEPGETLHWDVRYRSLPPTP